MDKEVNMKSELLRKKIESLKGYENLDKVYLDTLYEILINSTDWDLFRINPIRFALENNLNEQKIIDIFVHASKIGLFEFEWSMLCPKCGGVTSSHHAIDEIESEKTHCVFCDVDIETDLSEYVEVSFNLAESIKKLEIHPHENLENYMKFVRSKNRVAPKEFDDYINNEAFISFNVAEPDESIKIEFEAKFNSIYRLICVETNSLSRFTVDESTNENPQIIDIDMHKHGFSEADVEIAQGKTILHITNHSPYKVGYMFFSPEPNKIMSFLSKQPIRFDNYLNGKILLNNQNFRDLFKMNNLPDDLNLKVSDMTILFTDLKQSTELYDKIGDIEAYSLVQKHFDLLFEKTKENSGAIVKTIGDAVMSAFSNPLDGIKAATSMMKEIKKMNEGISHDIQIKVGLNSGTALAVMANEQIDYFGQTVNKAARVQGLADESEIWITDPILTFHEVKEFLDIAGYKTKRFKANLKGISKPITVHKLASNKK